MSTNRHSMSRNDAELEFLAAELTDAAFPAVLQLGIEDDWLATKLDLWKALDEAVRRRGAKFHAERASA